jgi:hypothetical protein
MASYLQKWGRARLGSAADPAAGLLPRDFITSDSGKPIDISAAIVK